MKYRLTKTLLCLAMSCTAGINCHNVRLESEITPKEEIVYKHHDYKHHENNDNGYHEYYHQNSSHHISNHHK